MSAENRKITDVPFNENTSQLFLCLLHKQILVSSHYGMFNSFIYHLYLAGQLGMDSYFQWRPNLKNIYMNIYIFKYFSSRMNNQIHLSWFKCSKPSLLS